MTSSAGPLELAVSGLRVGYPPGPVVVDDIDLTVPPGRLTALLGPSGCGKTTLLKAVAGLLTPVGGDIRIGGRSVLRVPAERRPVGLVFQKPLLFGHLTVGDNVAFGLRMRGMPRRDRRRRAMEMLERLGLAGLERRSVGELSGGQEQRVALARALVLDPQVLLLDEPFSQLDAELRGRMREQLRTVQRAFAVTTVFVTHDQQEAVEVADEIALMLHGRIEAHRPPAEFYTAPPTLRAARFFGGSNEILGALTGQEFLCALGRLRVAPGGHSGPGVLVVRPEAIRLGRASGTTGENHRAATVLDVRFHGTHQTVRVVLPGEVTLSVIAPLALAVGPGEVLSIHLPPAACRVLAAAPGPDRAPTRDRPRTEVSPRSFRA